MMNIWSQKPIKYKIFKMQMEGHHKKKLEKKNI